MDIDFGLVPFTPPRFATASSHRVTLWYSVGAGLKAAADQARELNEKVRAPAAERMTPEDFVADVAGILDHIVAEIHVTPRDMTTGALLKSARKVYPFRGLPLEERVKILSLFPDSDLGRLAGIAIDAPFDTDALGK